MALILSLYKQSSSKVFKPSSSLKCLKIQAIKKLEIPNSSFAFCKACQIPSITSFKAIFLAV